MSCGVIVEGMDRARWATLNFFTETLRGTHPAPANINHHGLLMVADSAADGPRALRGMFESLCGHLRTILWLLWPYHLQLVSRRRWLASDVNYRPHMVVKGWVTLTFQVGILK